MGRAFKELGFKREEIVVSTKLLRIGDGPNDTFLSRKHIIEGITNSLKRLQLDYVDVVFCHRPDYDTPLEETCRAMSWIVDNNKAFYWGTSDWPADRIAKAIEICERLNLHKPIVEQPQYNMLIRDQFEREYRRLFSENKYGTTIWSPLAGGILSGKYNDGVTPEGSRYDARKGNGFINAFWVKFFGNGAKESSLKKLKALGALAQDLGFSQAQLALAWTIANKDVSTCILGFTKLTQVEENLKALELYYKWTPEIEKKVRDILGNDPEPVQDWRTWQPLPNRRDEAITFPGKQ